MTEDTREGDSEAQKPAQAKPAARNFAAGAIICYAKCHACMYGYHFDPPQWHTWADDDDIEHAQATNQPDPRESRCGCRCARAEKQL